jgi:hypothetical protein
MGDDDQLAISRQGAHDRSGVIARPRVLILQWERGGEGFVAELAESLDRGAVYARIGSGAGDQDEDRHTAVSQAPRAKPSLRRRP